MNRKMFGATCLCCWLMAGSAGGEDFKLKIGRETTRVDGPVLADGTIDYLRAYEAEAAKGVTAENNAGAVIQRLLGLPWPEGVAGGPDKGEVGTATATSGPAAGSQAAPGVFVDWMAFGKQKEWDTGPQKEAWEKVKKEKMENLVDRTEKAPWKAEDFPLLAQWLAAEERPLKDLTAATLRPRYYIPQVLNPLIKAPLNKLWPGVPQNLSKSRVIANAFLMRAMLRAGSNDSAGALEDLQAIRRLGRLVRQEPALMSQLVAMSLEQMSWRVEMTLAEGDRLTADQRKQLASEARTTEEFRYAQEAIDVGERFFQLEMVMGAVRGDVEATVEAVVMASGLGWAYRIDGEGEKQQLELGDLKQTDWNIVLGMLNRNYDALAVIAVETDAVKQSGQADAFLAAHRAGVEAGIVVRMGVEGDQEPRTDAMRKKLVDTLETYLRRRTNESQATYSERIGVLFAGDYSTFGMMFKTVLRPRVYQRQLQIVLALRGFHESKGAYPAKLEELVPEFLPKVPGDPMAAGPMLYRREEKGYVVYSVGMNGKDDGGKDSRDQKDADDIVSKERARNNFPIRSLGLAKACLVANLHSAC